MPRPRKGPRLGAGPTHERRMMAEMAGSLVMEQRITTTLTKAKTLRPYVEKMITRARKGDLHSRRQILSQIEDTEIVTMLFDEVAPRYADRPGGYTRIVRIGPRRGDGTEMAVIEFV